MSQSARQNLFLCLKLLLKPIAKFSLKRSLRIQELLEAAKVAFVEAAAEEMERDGLEINFSRISVMTGLQRREVRRLYTDNPNLKQDSNFLHRVLNQWSQDPKFLMKNKRPRTLELDGVNSEFVELVSSVSKDLNPYTVLFELERTGSVKKDGNKIKLVSDVFVPKDIEDKFTLLGEDTNTLIEGVSENIFDDIVPKNLHVTTYYDNICMDKVTEIKNWFLDKGEKFHDEARKFLSKYDKDLNPALDEQKGGVKASITTFSKIEENKK